MHVVTHSKPEHALEKTADFSISKVPKQQSKHPTNHKTISHETKTQDPTMKPQTDMKLSKNLKNKNRFFTRTSLGT